jgi:hypothetical protein
MCEKEVLECPSCGEIALVEGSTVEVTAAFVGPYTFTEFECRECHHYETHG